ncbi:MAG: hypothetical protein JWP88_1219 [Flaviaesturariibacter sp.]|nr:hypothetical protein [Flaviaesturariibacter sp.]
MPEKHLFEYAVIRVVPQAEREEFMNVGVTLYCAKQRFLNAIITVDADRLKAFAPALDIAEMESYLSAFRRICCAERGSGPIGKLDLASRFRWLTATRSTIVQSSKIHPGLCNDPQETLERLHRQLVSPNSG